MITSISLLRVAACLGQLRQVVGPDRAGQFDAALVSLADGDVKPTLGLLSRASVGLRDGPLREVVTEAWALLDAVEVELSEAKLGRLDCVAARW